MQKANPKKASRGFTLLELIIVIAILAILSVAVVLVINPAETLARARDSQRLSDLSAVKSSLGLYLAEAADPQLDDDPAADGCAGFVYVGNNSAIADVTDDICGVADGANQVESAVQLVDGTGWIPVDLENDIDAGAPISNFPLDPNPIIDAAGTFDEGDRVYVYMCDDTNNSFELNATMESVRYSNGGSNDAEMTDGGDNDNVYEIGTDSGLDLCGAW